MPNFVSSLQDHEVGEAAIVIVVSRCSGKMKAKVLFIALWRHAKISVYNIDKESLYVLSHAEPKRCLNKEAGGLPFSGSGSHKEARYLSVARLKGVGISRVEMLKRKTRLRFTKRAYNSNSHDAGLLEGRPTDDVKATFIEAIT